MHAPEREPNGPERDIAVEQGVIVVDAAERRCAKHERGHLQGADGPLYRAPVARSDLTVGLLAVTDRGGARDRLVVGGVGDGGWDAIRGLRRAERDAGRGGHR